MSGIVTLVLLAFLCAICLRWLSRRLRLPAPTYVAVFVVFTLVVLALWGQNLD
jgi:predicted PurR-regulated permease PerM